MTQQRRGFVGIEVGDTFSSYEELKTKIDDVQERTEVPLLIRDCITLKGAVKKRPNVASSANPDLQYHSLHYICVCGRNDPTRRMYFIRQGVLSQCLCKEGEKCRAEIKVGLSEDFQKLRVKRIIDIHNHKISQKLFKVVSRDRLLASQKKSAKSNNITDLKQQPGRECRKRRRKPQPPENNDEPLNEKAIITTLPSNPTQMKRKCPDSQQKRDGVKRANTTKAGILPAKVKMRRRVGFKRLIEEMYQQRGSTYEVFEEGLNPQAIFFQTLEMRRNFAAYPEVLMIDSSYKIPDLSMQMYAVMNADGNGECTIISFWFIVHENEKNLHRLVDAFTSLNPSHNCIKVVMLEEGFQFKDLVHSRFPAAARFISYYHSVREFRKELYGVNDVHFDNEEDRGFCLKLFKKMALAKDRQGYSAHFNRFKLYAPIVLYNYFLLNWHRSQSVWVDALKHPNAYFLNQRHSRLDAIDQILKSVCGNFKSIPHFFHDLVKSVATLKLERKQRALNVPVKGPVVTSEFHIAEMQYQNLLTPYAFTFMKKQLHSSKKVVLQNSKDGKKRDVKSVNYGELGTTSTSCSCVFYDVTALPCSHIFAIRGEKGLPAYVPSLCSPRWTLHYLRRMLDLPDENKGLLPDTLFNFDDLENDYTCENDDEVQTEEDTNSKDENLPFVLSHEVQVGDSDAVSKDEELPFVPSCAIPSVGGEEAVDGESVEECIIDEVDPDFDISQLLDEENDGNGESDSELPNIDWVKMLETL